MAEVVVVVYFVCIVCVMWMLLNVAGQVAQGGFESRVTHVRWSVIVPLAQQHVRQLSMVDFQKFV